MYPDRPKDSEIHSDSLLPTAKIKIRKGEKPPSQETLQKKKGKSTKSKRQMYSQILSKNELVINAEEEKGEEEGRKRKQ